MRFQDGLNDEVNIKFSLRLFEDLFHSYFLKNTKTNKNIDLKQKNNDKWLNQCILYPCQAT